MQSGCKVVVDKAGTMSLTFLWRSVMEIVDMSSSLMSSLVGSSQAAWRFIRMMWCRMRLGEAGSCLRLPIDVPK